MLLHELMLQVRCPNPYVFFCVTRVNYLALPSKTSTKTFPPHQRSSPFLLADSHPRAALLTKLETFILSIAFPAKMEMSLPSFDLEAYAARYEGRVKIQRLRSIATRSPQLRPDALRMAVKEAKLGRDTLLYRNILKQAEGLSGPDFEIDQSWIRRNDQWASKALEKLRYDLEENKQQANKEVIRTGHNDLGDFFAKRGKMLPARGEYTKTRDYCISPQHTLQMCFKVITVSIEAEDFTNVENHYMMAENIPDVEKTSPELAKMRACAGLALLVKSNYATATTRFLQTNLLKTEEAIVDLQQQFGDVMALEDVATYGALCALATLERPSLTKHIIEHEAFRMLLELVPDVREVVFDFYHSRYTRCLGTLERIRPELMLDMYLGRDEHVDNLYRLIRRKAIMQYVSPFASADLGRMRTVFGTNRAELEEELLGLIESGLIDARIDTQNDALRAKKRNGRLLAIAASLERGQETFEEAEAMLLRMTLTKHDVRIASPNLMAGGGDLGGRGRSVSSIADNVFDRGLRNG